MPANRSDRNAVDQRMNRNDVQPLRPAGQPLTFRELQAIAEISPQDISAAVDRFHRSVPPRFERLLD